MPKKRKIESWRKNVNSILKDSQKLHYLIEMRKVPGWGVMKEIIEALIYDMDTVQTIDAKNAETEVRARQNAMNTLEGFAQIIEGAAPEEVPQEEDKDKTLEFFE